MVTVDGFAKVNLTLDILGRREDGFHEVSMVMQSLALHDTVTVEKAEEGITLSIEPAGLELAADESNLAYRAAEHFMERYGLLGGVAIRLVKRIPIAAGLAGGSADAAAVLVGMDRLFHLSLGEDELLLRAAELGSDVPFVLAGGTMLATGRGEELRRLSDLPETPVVLAKPPISISTTWAYKAYDAAPDGAHPDTAAMEAAVAAGDVPRVASLLCNVLAPISRAEHAVIGQYEEKMKQAGAPATMMSGSGPTVFALAESEEKAEAIAAAMREEEGAEVIVTKTRGRVFAS